MSVKLEDLNKSYVGGKWATGSGGTFEVEDPASGNKISDVYNCTPDDVRLAIASASDAFTSWSQTSVVERANLLMKLRDAIMKHKDELAVILTRENGKPKQESLGEINMGATFFEWYAGETRRQYGEVIPSANKTKRLITYRQPLGVAALITPWNFPFAMLARKVSAALAAGCTCVIKPPEDTPLTAVYFGVLCDEVGVPPGIVNVVPCSRDRVAVVGDALCQSEKVKVLSFTGSTAVGQKLYSQCGKTLKKLSMELGGNAPFIVFPSADLDEAVMGLMIAKFRNNGQSCIGANRIFVHEKGFDEFVNKLCLKIKEFIKVGNGMDEGVNIGPLINQRQLDRVIKLVDNAVKGGAKVVLGATPPQGLFLQPTVLVNVDSDMDIVRQEIFGPVAVIRKFGSDDEVVRMANDTDMGLAAYIFTKDVQQSWRISEQLEFSMVGVNETLFSVCEAPFGGIKSSGFGKEGSKHGLDDFTNLKYVCYGNV